MNTHYRYYPLEYFFKVAKQNGFKNAEIWLCPQHFFINYNESENPKKLLELSKTYDIKIKCLCPEQNNPKPNNIAARDKFLISRTYNYFKRIIDLANYIGCSKVLVTPGWNYYDEELTIARKRSATMLKNICDYAESRRVTLVLESIWKQSSDIAPNIEKIKTLKESINRKNLKLTIDLGAISAANESIKDWFEAFGEDIEHCHFVDGNPTGHLSWGRGNRNMTNDLKHFYKNGYNGGFSLEFVNPVCFRNPSVEDLKTIEIFKKSLSALSEHKKCEKMEGNKQHDKTF